MSKHDKLPDRDCGRLGGLHLDYLKCFRKLECLYWMYLIFLVGSLAK